MKKKSLCISPLFSILNFYDLPLHSLTFHFICVILHNDKVKKKMSQVLFFGTSYPCSCFTCIVSFLPNRLYGTVFCI